MDRNKTLLERIEHLESHHEETRSRMHAQQQQIQHLRERVDLILGDEEPKIAEAPMAEARAASR